MHAFTLSNTLFKRSLSIALCGLLATSGTLFLTANAEKTLKGGVIHTDKYNNTPSINPDDIKEITPGTVLDMVISTGLSTGVSTEGDEFFAKVTKDYVVDGKVVIPKGTLVHGTVQQMTDRKRAGRNAWIATKFDYMITPDDREIPIEGQHTTRDSKLKAAAKVVGRASGYTAVGGVLGALTVLKYGGIAAVVASEGYALAGGAAVGGTIGLTAAMIKKGKSAMIEPGAEIRVKLSEPIQLPTMNMPDVTANDTKLEGLDVKVLGLRYDKDPFGEANEITLSLDIGNYTENTFSSFEIGLQDEYGNTFYPSPFGDTGLWFKKLTPNTKSVANVSFNVDNPKQQHYLVFFKQYTREPLAKIAISDAMQPQNKTAQKAQKKLMSKKASADNFDF